MTIQSNLTILVPYQEVPQDANQTQDLAPSLLSRQGGVKVLQRIDHTLAQGSRRFWHFLTLGVPAIIKALSLFFESFICRIKKGPTYTFRFAPKHITPEKSLNLDAFYRFNEAVPGLLKNAEANKILQMLNILVNQREIAKCSDNPDEVATITKKMDALSCILEKNKKKGLSRKDLSAEEWTILDNVCYELAVEFFANLSNMFNTGWFHSLCFDSIMEQTFYTNYQEALIAENLALSLAYIEGLDGKILSLPVFDEGSKGYKQVNYRIQESTLGDNLPCYILESIDPSARPWVVVRGTQYYTDLSSKGKELRRGSLESILADSIDHKCIARHVINKTLLTRPKFENDKGIIVEQESLGDFFEKWHQENKQANLTGHSLGATFVNNLAVEFYDDVYKAYAFSGAGVSKKIAKRWNFLVEKTRVRKELSIEAREMLNAKLVNFDYEGDLIPSGGSRLIGQHLAIKKLAKRQMEKMYYCHVTPHLNNNFALSLVDITKEKKKLARWFCEELRIATGRCFRFLLTMFNSKLFPDWWVKRKVYKEAAYHHRILVKEMRRRQSNAA